jgi:hypothetical protein
MEEVEPRISKLQLDDVQTEFDELDENLYNRMQR